MHTRFPLLTTAVAVLAALPLFSACTTPGPGSGNPPPEETTGQVTGPPRGQATGPRRGDAEATTGSLPPPDPRSCSTRGLDLAETSFGRYTPLGVVPTGTSGVWFNFEITDNRFDPCLPLSWIVLSGANGDHIQPLGSRVTAAEAVVFFHYDAPVTTPPPVQFHEIQAVERIAGNAVAVTYGHAGGATAHGVTETFTATHSWEEGPGPTGPVTTGPGSAAYEAAATQVLTLDVDALPPPHDSPVVLLGNARESRLAAQHDLRDRTEALTVQIPLRGPGLTCSFSSPAAPVTCRGNGMAWPEIPEGPTEETSWSGPGPADGLGIHHLPTSVSTTWHAPTLPAPDVELPDESLSRVGAYLVDTAGEKVVFSSGSSGVEVTTTAISLVETDYIDTSRW